jgi:teichuronic acid biosynthesis glycosyltransferase TuaC
MRILAVTNIYPTPSNPSSGTFVEQQVQGLRNVGLEVAVLFVDRRERGIGAYYNVSTEIRSCLRTFDADIVHVMYGGVLADMTTRSVRDRPTVVTFHGADLVGEHLAGHLRRLIAAYGVLCSWQAARRASGVIAVATALRDTLPRNVDRSRTRVIPCGIDLTRFTPIEQSRCRQLLNWRDGLFHVLFNSSSGDPKKRPDLARASVEVLNRTGIQTEMHVLRGIANCDVPVWLNASDVLLLTSRDEGSPTIVKEALACNIPVVSVDVGDVRERIQEIEGCYLAPSHPDDLATKLRLVHDGPRRVTARATIEALSVDRIAVRLQEFYEELSVTRPDQVHIRYRKGVAST